MRPPRRGARIGVAEMDIAMEAVVNATLDILGSIVVNESVLVTMHGLIFQLKTIQLMPHIQNALIWYAKLYDALKFYGTNILFETGAVRSHIRSVQMQGWILRCRL